MACLGYESSRELYPPLTPADREKFKLAQFDCEPDNDNPNDISNGERALALAAQDFAVFPCRHRDEIDPQTGEVIKGKEVKTPLTPHGHNDATTNEAQIRVWWSVDPDALVGMATGEKSGIDVIDLDRKDGADGFAAIKKVCPPNIPETFFDATPSGGAHLLYLRRPESKIRGRSHLFQATLGTKKTGIDTRGEGAYAIFYGLVPPNVRELCSPWPEEFDQALEREEKAREKARKARNDNAPRDSSTYPAPDLAHDWNRVSAALEFVPADDRDDWVAVGMAIKAHFGEKGRGLWGDWSATSDKFDARDQDRKWNSFNGSGVALGTLFHIAERYGYRTSHANGERYAHGPNGAASESFAGTEAKAEADGQLPQIYTAAELKGREFPPVKFIHDGLISEGCFIFGGRPKMGKSWYALDLAYGVATGTEVMGRACEHGDVLYCALEDNPRRIKNRLGRIVQDDDWPGSLYLAHGWPKGKDAVAAARGWLKSVDNPKLIIVDTLKKVRAASSGKHGDNYNDDYEAVEAWQQFYIDTGISVLIVTHTRKAEADDPFDAITGTLGQTGAADGVVVWVKERNGTTTMHGTGRDMEQYSHAISFDKDACKWEIVEEDVAPAKTAKAAKVADINPNEQRFAEAFDACAAEGSVPLKINGVDLVAIDVKKHKATFIKRYPGENLLSAKSTYNRERKKADILPKTPIRSL